MFKKKRRIRNAKMDRITIGSSLIVLFVLMLTIGFSAFESTLYVDGMTIDVRPVKSIRVTGVSVDEKSDTAKSIHDYNVHNINGTIDLLEKDSTITYRVQITNIGNTGMGIYKIALLDDYSYLNDILEITLDEKTDYVMQEKLCTVSEEEKRCTGIQKDIYITIKYKEGKYNASNTHFDFVLDFDFRSFYEVSYTDMPTIPLPYEVIEGGTLNAILPFTIQSVMVSGSLGESIDHIFENGILQVENITSDILVKGKGFIWNMQDMVSIILTAEGALNELHAISQRMNELTVHSANATAQDDDRYWIQQELDQLSQEMQRIIAETLFDNRVLLDGTFREEWPIAIHEIIQIEIKKMNLNYSIDATTEEKSYIAIEEVKKNIDEISKIRNYLGSIQNTLEKIMDFYNRADENMNAYSENPKKLNKEMMITGVSIIQDALDSIDWRLEIMQQMDDIDSELYLFQTNIEEDIRVIKVISTATKIQNIGLLNGEYDNSIDITLEGLNLLELKMDTKENREDAKSRVENAKLKTSTIIDKLKNSG